MIIGKYPSLRLRRTRKYNWSRKLVQENNLSSDDLIYPIFLIEGKNKIQAIKSMPPIYKNEVTGETTFISPDGNVVQKMPKKGSRAVIAGPKKKSLKDMGKEEE